MLCHPRFVGGAQSVAVLVALLVGVGLLVPSPAGAADDDGPTLGTADWWVAANAYSGGGPLEDLTGSGAPAEMLNPADPPIWRAAPIDTSRCLRTNGTAEEFASTPDSSAVSPSGDLDIRADLRPDDWDVSAQAFGTKFFGAPTLDSYEVGAWDGKAFFEWTDSHRVEHLVRIDPEPDAVGRAAFRFTLDVDDGAGRHVVRAYRDAPPATADVVTADGQGWDEVRVWQRQGVTDVIDSGYPLTISGPYDQGEGRTCRLQVFAGIDGTPVADFDPAGDAVPGARTWASEASRETWTVRGTASLLEADTQLEPRFEFVGGRGIRVVRGPLADLGDHDRTVALAFRPLSAVGVYLRSTSDPAWAMAYSGAEGYLACLCGPGGVSHDSSGVPAVLGVDAVAVIRYRAETRELEVFVDGASNGPSVLSAAPPPGGVVALAGDGTNYQFLAGAAWNRALDDDEIGVLTDEFAARADDVSITTAVTAPTVAAGDPIDVEVTITNESAAALTGVTVSDPQAPACAGPVPDIAPGQAVAIDCARSTTAGEAATIRQRATLDADQTGAIPSNTVAVEVFTPPTGFRGTVSDGAGQPVAGLLVAARHAGDGSYARGATTQTDGSYEIRQLEPGPYVLAVIDRNGDWAEAADSVGDELAVTTDQLTVRDVTVLATRGVVRGDVVDRATGVAIRGATVALTEDGGATSVAVTNAAGRYRFAHVDPGSYRVVVADPSGAHRPGRTGGAEIGVAAGAVQTANAALPARPRATVGVITGQVTDADATPGTGVRGATVVAVRAGNFEFAGAATTDPAGRYRLTLPAGGRYFLQASQPVGRYRSEWFDDEPQPSGAADLTSVHTGVFRRLKLTPVTGSIGGVVYGSPDGAPLAGTWVLALGETGVAGVAVTGEDGFDGQDNYLLGGLPPGTYRVAAIDPVGGRPSAGWDGGDGGGPDDVPFVVTAGQGTIVEVALPPA